MSIYARQQVIRMARKRWRRVVPYFYTVWPVLCIIPHLARSSRNAAVVPLTLSLFHSLSLLSFSLAPTFLSPPVSNTTTPSVLSSSYPLQTACAPPAPCRCDADRDQHTLHSNPPSQMYLISLLTLSFSKN